MDPFLDTLSGWGRIPAKGREVFAEDLEKASASAVLCRGLGRSYGDSALPPPGHPEVLTTTFADRILAFDSLQGRIRTEAGVSIEQLNHRLLRRGWFVPVTPGTQFVTVGGAVAADVHGKNHHVDGCFGDHVTSLRMRLAGGEIVTCSPNEHADLFWATVGGMGLTGHILEVEFSMNRVPSSWIWQETERVDDIDEYVTALKRAAKKWRYTMGWIDCLSPGKHMGRGILMAGDWATPEVAPKRFATPRLRFTMPVELPGIALGPATVKAFNFLYYWKHLPRTTKGLVHWETFFYPLDMVRLWNRMYGKRGFTQYQCVLPESAGHDAARRVLEVLTQRGGASFLCVIKDCGPQNRGMLSFPMKGISIALDIPVRDNTQALIDALNERVIEERGRIYLAKDNFTRKEHYRAMDPRVDEFLAIRRKWDPQGKIRSLQSVRLFDDRP